jgi:hypothetical protein
VPSTTRVIITWRQLETQTEKSAPNNNTIRRSGPLANVVAVGCSRIISNRHRWAATYPFDDGQRVGETQHPELPLSFVFSPQVPRRVLAIVDLRAKNKHGVHKSPLNIRTTSAPTHLTRTCLTPPGKHTNCLKETRQQIGTPGTCTRYTTLQLAHKAGRGLHGL